MKNPSTISDIVSSLAPQDEKQQRLDDIANHQQILQGIELNNAVIDGLDLSKFMFNNSIFNNVTMYNSTLGDVQDSLFFECRLLDTNLLHANNDCFEHTFFSKCYFGARSQSLKFINSWIISCVFGEFPHISTPSRNAFHSTTLSRVLACGADFRKSMFFDCRLTHSNFSRASFSGALIESTLITNSNFCQSDIDSKCISNLHLHKSWRPKHLATCDSLPTLDKLSRFFGMFKNVSNHHARLKATICMAGYTEPSIIRLCFLVDSNDAIYIQTSDYLNHRPLINYGNNKDRSCEIDIIPIVSDHLGFEVVGSDVAVFGDNHQSHPAFYDELAPAWASIADSLSKLIGD